MRFLPFYLFLFVALLLVRLSSSASALHPLETVASSEHEAIRAIVDDLAELQRWTRNNVQRPGALKLFHTHNHACVTGNFVPESSARLPISLQVGLWNEETQKALNASKFHS